jgi:hypothetical protein
MSEKLGGERRRLPVLGEVGYRLAIARSFHRFIGDGLCFCQSLINGLLTCINCREFLAHFSAMPANSGIAAN